MASNLIGLASNLIGMASTHRIGIQPNRNGLQPNRNGLQPHRIGLQPNRNGLQPNRNGLQPNRIGLQPPLRLYNLAVESAFPYLFIPHEFLTVVFNSVRSCKCLPLLPPTMLALRGAISKVNRSTMVKPCHRSCNVTSKSSRKRLYINYIYGQLASQGSRRSFFTIPPVGFPSKGVSLYGFIYAGAWKRL